MLEAIAEKYVAKEHIGYHGDKLSAHSYIPIYEKLFRHKRASGAVRLLEVGVAAGLSLRMWKDYFAPGSLIAGLDPNDQWMTAELREEFPIAIGHSQVPSGRTKAWGISETYDIIIDDGDHSPWSQLCTFHNLWPLLANGGIYVIEDIENIDAWRHEFEGLHKSCEVIDLRGLRNRADDVLVVFFKPGGQNRTA